MSKFTQLWMLLHSIYRRVNQKLQYGFNVELIMLERNLIKEYTFSDFTITNNLLIEHTADNYIGSLLAFHDFLDCTLGEAIDDIEEFFDDNYKIIIQDSKYYKIVGQTYRMIKK